MLWAAGPFGSDGAELACLAGRGFGFGCAESAGLGAGGAPGGADGGVIISPGMLPEGGPVGCGGGVVVTTRPGIDDTGAAGACCADARSAAGPQARLDMAITLSDAVHRMRVMVLGDRAAIAVL